MSLRVSLLISILFLLLFSSSVNSYPVINGQRNGIFVINERTSFKCVLTDMDPEANPEWSIRSIQPLSELHGSVTIDHRGILTFSPALEDMGHSYTVIVRVTDRFKGFEECSAVFKVSNDSRFRISIGTVRDVLQGHHVLVPVTKESGNDEIWGFDFLFGYDAQALSFMGANQGEIFDLPGSYEWEYFTYRYGADGNCGVACPSGMLRMVALADVNDGPHQPKTKILPDGIVLFTFDFLVSNDRTLECQRVPLRFFWTDCGDNSIVFHRTTDPSYTIYSAISNTVTDSAGAEIQNFSGALPTYQGAPDSCLISDPGQVPAYRYIDFVNGEVAIVCAESIDVRGDINLNGLSNEIGDAVLFTNYFISGLAVFNINVDGQIAATDVKRDSVFLRVDDLAYLIRIIVGDALPLSKLPRQAGNLYVRNWRGAVTVGSEVGVFHGVFEGNVEVTLGVGAKYMEFKSGYNDGQTHVLIYSFDRDRTCNGEILKTSGRLISAEASTYSGAIYNSLILPSGFQVKNYPNPFNSSATIEMFLPEAVHWDITIYNVAGQQIDRLSGESGGGLERVIWDASNQATGIYFYKVAAGNNSAARKMVILK